MPENEKCNCPFCKQNFTPENGLTREEHLARGIIQIYRKMQDDPCHNDYPCPRCGNERMKPELVENALSRHVNLYICNECGIDEALRDTQDDALILTNWYIVKALLNSSFKK